MIVAFAMYSKLPMPRVDWEEKALSWALCWFPLVGAVIGAALYGWMALAEFLHIGSALFAAVALLLPIAFSGGIHLDGFCDTCDALSSHQSRERKLEILKDSHTGAFAIICCGLYLLVFFGAWCEVELTERTAVVLALGPVLSRSLSGFFAVNMPNARGTGMLATFTGPMDRFKADLALGAWVAMCGVAIVVAALAEGGALLAGAFLVCLYYQAMCKKQFGGVTGDLAGFFLQTCELVMVLAVVIAQKVVAVV
ncbi:adenosylcobinamide-GDP ribazoletransferase [uncultured Flavonifractor sp.]|uniref:adenosylcobinamide-GDP ribazoletransferase n=1 Tax=uncultured Flavonifractor sp. TaxID=1193534 RepID=UPI00261ED4C8|nr:adenosylcobinamide-GDP ribazoletransferase [uncultured Flavonifractor sp.]